MSRRPQIVHMLAEQQPKAFSAVLLCTYKHFVTTFKRTIKPITKIFVTNRNALQIILLHTGYQKLCTSRFQGL